jgi:hypothetical protein
MSWFPNFSLFGRLGPARPLLHHHKIGRRQKNGVALTVDGEAAGGVAGTHNSMINAARRFDRSEMPTPVRTGIRVAPTS